MTDFTGQVAMVTGAGRARGTTAGSRASRTPADIVDQISAQP